jgi:superfamily II DNA or RNA helicase
MQLTIDTPTTVRIPTEVVGIAKEHLKYEQKSVTHEWLRWKRIQDQPTHWWYRSHTKEELELKVSELNEERHKSLLLKDEHGYYTYSGLASKLSSILNIPVVRTFQPPEFSIVGWENNPFNPKDGRDPIEARWYQTKSVELLSPDDYSRNQGAIEAGTGLGKSLIIAMLLKKIGLPAIIVTPTISICDQLHKNLTDWFGSDKVGIFNGKKKKPQKMFVVAVAASLTKVKENSKEFKALTSKQVLICDESHLLPAETLAKVTFGLLKGIYYRYFFSGTQIRNDGLGLLLEGIIGDVVLEMTVKQGIDQGFLSPLKFFQWNIKSDNPLDCDDSIKMNRVHLHANPKVNKHAVKLAKYAVSKGRKVLILIEEIDQFIRLMKEGLLDGLRVAFAHGGLVEPDHKKAIPVIFHKSDALDIVDRFDKGEYDVLVGTSCIQTGTDIKSVSCIISLVGLTSEIQIRQGVIGRGTRLFPGKVDCTISDYCVENVEKLAKHAKKRRKIFDSVYSKTIVLEAK